MQSAIGLDHPASNGPRLLLAEHHREIESACDGIRAVAFTDDRAELVLRFRAFEHALLEHMRAEEAFILPDYAKAEPEEAAALFATHEELRRQLFRMAIDVELHAVRVGGLDELVATLRKHAADEDRAMYPWAQVHLPLRTRRELFSRIGRSLRALGRDQRWQRQGLQPQR